MRLLSRLSRRFSSPGPDSDTVPAPSDSPVSGISSAAGSGSAEPLSDSSASGSSSGLIRVAVLSDSHGLLRREVIAELQDCSHILHAGDIIRETDLDELGVYGSLYAVLGNNDIYMPWSGRLKAILRFTIGGVRFLMTHERWNIPRDLSDVDVVIYGHTHSFAQESVDGRLWLNPGSCGPSRFGSEASMAKLDIKSGRILRVRQILI